MKKVFHPVARTDELAEGAGKLVSVGEDDFALFRHEGRFYCIGSLCPHANEPLHLGCLEGREVVCRRHFLRFDIKTGDCANAGGFSVATYETKTEDGIVSIGLWEE